MALGTHILTSERICTVDTFEKAVCFPFPDECHLAIYDRPEFFTLDSQEALVDLSDGLARIEKLSDNQFIHLSQAGFEIAHSRLPSALKDIGDQVMNDLECLGRFATLDDRVYLSLNDESSPRLYSLWHAHGFGRTVRIDLSGRRQEYSCDEALIEAFRSSAETVATHDTQSIKCNYGTVQTLRSQHVKYALKTQWPFFQNTTPAAVYRSGALDSGAKLSMSIIATYNHPRPRQGRSTDRPYHAFFEPDAQRLET